MICFLLNDNMQNSRRIESELVVQGDGLEFSRSIIKHVRARQTGKYWSPTTGFMLLQNENVINFTAKSMAYRLCYISHVKLFPNQNILAFVFQDLSQFSLLERWLLASLKFVHL